MPACRAVEEHYTFGMHLQDKIDMDTWRVMQRMSKDRQRLVYKFAETLAWECFWLRQDIAEALERDGVNVDEFFLRCLQKVASTVYLYACTGMDFR